MAGRGDAALSGKLLTGRDAAHKRMADMIAEGRPLPVDMRGRAIYYVGPVKAVRDEVVGPAGPTTAHPHGRFHRSGAARDRPAGDDRQGRARTCGNRSDRRYRAPYLIAVGGAAYLISKSIKSARVVAFEDLGMEAIHEFEVRDMPVTVAVDVTGQSIHQSGPQEWQRRIAEASV